MASQHSVQAFDGCDVFKFLIPPATLLLNTTLLFNSVEDFIQGLGAPIVQPS